MDNLVIIKTQTANLPGDWAGAYISVETKDFPEQFTLNYSSTVGMNDQTTFQQVLGSNQGSTDWLGFDDGSRALPNEVAGLTSDAWPYQQNANYYDAFVYLGYEDQLDQLGINQGDIGFGLGPNPSLPGVVPTQQQRRRIGRLEWRQWVEHPDFRRHGALGRRTTHN